VPDLLPDLLKTSSTRGVEKPQKTLEEYKTTSLKW
jgi:hypothetical protein